MPPKYNRRVCNLSSKNKTVFKIFDVKNFTSDGRFCDKLSHKPLVILLENSFTRNAEFFAECIQTRLRGDSLPTTVKDGHVSVTNLSDLIPVETYNRDASLRVKVYRSVARLPVDVLLDCSTHLRFDLTHESECVWGSLPLMHISYPTEHPSQAPLCHFPHCHTVPGAPLSEVLI